SSLMAAFWRSRRGACHLWIFTRSGPHEHSSLVGPAVGIRADTPLLDDHLRCPVGTPQLHALQRRFVMKRAVAVQKVPNRLRMWEMFREYCHGDEKCPVLAEIEGAQRRQQQRRVRTLHERAGCGKIKVESIRQRGLEEGGIASERRLAQLGIDAGSATWVEGSVLPRMVAT